MVMKPSLSSDGEVEETTAKGIGTAHFQVPTSSSGGDSEPLVSPSSAPLSPVLSSPSFLFGPHRRFANDDSLSGDQAILRLLAVGGLLFLGGLYLLHIVAICYGRYRLHRLPKQTQQIGGVRRNALRQIQEDPLVREWPGVSVLKPLVGTDENLAENLESFFTLDYPNMELLFCLNSREDPAYRVVESLCAKYPSVEKRIFIGGEKVGLNPKINNMYPAYTASRYPLFLISDQGIFMRQQALKDMVATLLEHPNVALVTQPPYCRDRGDSFGAALEQVYFGGAHSRIYLASHAFGFVCSTGMSALMVKDIVEQCGGFKQFGAYLAEDYFLGQAFVKGGFRNVISHMPALQNSARPTVRSFQERICRWIKLRIAMLPHTILLEPAQECLVASFVGAFSVAQFFGLSAVPLFLIAHFAYWCLGDFLLLITLQNGPLPFSVVTFLLCWLFRELMAFPTFVKAVLNPHIGWRFGTYRLCWGGRIKPPPKLT
ncbi:hypothetical protein GPALN_008019 [Globodera pallida]|uniref:ceramide glucosyltransferase n=1 Tax=Globodera pallida TaxID=36090 RepID=A0A183C1F4_GLOPA|nr:hypothetical protein GPALN_008019 [Globodera pallida]